MIVLLDVWLNCGNSQPSAPDQASPQRRSRNDDVPALSLGGGSFAG